MLTGCAGAAKWQRGGEREGWWRREAAVGESVDLRGQRGTASVDTAGLTELEMAERRGSWIRVAESEEDQ